MIASRSFGQAAAAFAALARTQTAAAASTALFRNQFVDAAPPARDGTRDFDFYFGRWRVHNERLRERLAGCREWDRFEAIQECRPILGGLGNIDEFVTDEFGPTLFIGMTLRLYDRESGNWSIWWSSNRRGTLEPPVTGRFVDGVGQFEGDDVHAGTPVRVRFVWSEIGPDRAHWQQAFSTDGGRSWETNWHMRMTRLAPYRPGHGEAA
jgi:hypothetical protein